jgi:hypothetical protein
VNESPLDILREARRNFGDWLIQANKSPDPSTHDRGEFSALARQLQIAEQAMRVAPSSLRASDAWKDETAEYARALREMKARLSNLEITLRIRSAQMSQKQVKLEVIRSWADLARHIG